MAENISDNNVVDPAKVTSVLIGAQVCDAEGNALDLVRHNGLLFKKDAYLNYVVNVVNNANPFNAYTSYVDETDNETKYKKLDGSYLKLVRDADSKALTVVVDEQQFAGEKNSILSLKWMEKGSNRIVNRRC